MAGGLTIIPRSRNRIRLPTTISSPPTEHTMPLPGRYSKRSGSMTGSVASAAFFRIALPRGCSDGRSAMAAASITAFWVTPSTGRTSVTSGAPSVSVPVLSRTTVSTRPRIWRYSPPLMIAPCRAARPIAPRIASGVPAAMPHAPATITTEMVARTSRVTSRVNAGVAARDHSVHRHARAGFDDYHVAHAHFIEAYRARLALAPHERLARQQIEQVLHRPSAAPDRQPFQDFRDQHEEDDDERGEDFGDRQRRADGDGHREFHRHPALGEGRDGFLEDRIAADQRRYETDCAEMRVRLPGPEPERDDGEPYETYTDQLWRF